MLRVGYPDLGISVSDMDQIHISNLTNYMTRSKHHCRHSYDDKNKRQVNETNKRPVMSMKHSLVYNYCHQNNIPNFKAVVSYADRNHEGRVGPHPYSSVMEG